MTLSTLSSEVSIVAPHSPNYGEAIWNRMSGLLKPSPPRRTESTIEPQDSSTQESQSLFESSLTESTEASSLPLDSHPVPISSPKSPRTSHRDAPSQPPRPAHASVAPPPAAAAPRHLPHPVKYEPETETETESEDEVPKTDEQRAEKRAQWAREMKAREEKEKRLIAERKRNMTPPPNRRNPRPHPTPPPGIKVIDFANLPKPPPIPDEELVVDPDWVVREHPTTDMEDARTRFYEEWEQKHAHLYRPYQNRCDPPNTIPKLWGGLSPEEDAKRMKAQKFKYEKWQEVLVHAGGTKEDVFLAIPPEQWWDPAVVKAYVDDVREKRQDIGRGDLRPRFIGNIRDSATGVIIKRGELWKYLDEQEQKLKEAQKTKERLERDFEKMDEEYAAALEAEARAPKGTLHRTMTRIFITPTPTPPPDASTSTVPAPIAGPSRINKRALPPSPTTIWTGTETETQTESEAEAEADISAEGLSRIDINQPTPHPASSSVPTHRRRLHTGPQFPPTFMTPQRADPMDVDRDADADDERDTDEAASVLKDLKGKRKATRKVPPAAKMEEDEAPAAPYRLRKRKVPDDDGRDSGAAEKPGPTKKRSTGKGKGRAARAA